MSAVRIGTRGSELALWQATRVRDALAHRHTALTFEIIVIQSRGDEASQARIADLGVVGVFTRALERALLEERIDVAVHSLKDLPTQPPDGLDVAAVLPRDDPRDALVLRGAGAPAAGTSTLEDEAASHAALARLPQGARVGTSSLRRRAELLRLRSDLQVIAIRGNVPTRVRHVEQATLDAVVLSYAGLTRLGLQPADCTPLAPNVMLPAPAQGTIAAQTRLQGDTLRLVADVDDLDTRIATTAERTLLRLLEGGCRVPLGAWARLEAGTLVLSARVLSLDGRERIDETERHAGDPAQLAAVLAARLRARGAIELLAHARASST